MKSFFKKLAFVMALAMVVSLAAPAATAAHADEAGIALQGTNTIVATYELEKDGASVDFCFKGAPKDWKTTYKWTSSDEAVATVDKAGVVTPVAAGTATITITAGADASYVQTVKVTVKEEKKADAFVAAQADLTHFTMTFDAKKEVKAEDVAVVLMINDVEAPIPVKSVAVAENVATVELFSEFIDGVTYKVTYAKETDEFVGSIGAIDKVAFNYWTVKEGDSVAYVTTEEEPSVAKLTYQLFDANGVDVTSAYDEDELTVEYSIVNESEDFEVIDDELIFYAAGAAVVEVKVVWTSEDGDEVEKAGNGVVVATKRPAISHSLVEGGFLVADWYAPGAVADFTTNKDSVFWKNNSYKNSWILNDEATLQFASVVKDNRGNTVVTGINDYGRTYWDKDDDGSYDYPYGYFKFVTSNDDVVDLDEDGSNITFWNTGSASIITYFVDTTGEEDKEVFVGATKITVNPSRYPATYTLASNSVSVASHTAGSGHDADFVLTVFDQYGNNIALKGGESAITVEKASTTEEAPDAVVDYSEGRWDWNGDGVFDNGCSGWWCGNSKGGVHYHITIAGDGLAKYLGDKTTKTAQYVVTVDKSANSKLSTNATAKLKATVKKTADYANALSAGTTDKFYYSVGGGGSVDVAVSAIKNYSWTGASANPKSKDIAFTYLNTAGGFAMKPVPSSNIVEMVKDQTTGDAGTLYYEVSVPKNAKNWSLTKSDGKLTFEWNKGTDILAHATTGTYKVDVYYVKNTSIGNDGTGKLSKFGTYSYNVTNSQESAKFAGYDSKLGNKTTKEITEENAEEIIKENLKFTYQGVTIDWDNSDYNDYKLILEINTDDKKVVAGGNKLRVNKVTIIVPIEGTPYSYKKEITVGKTIYYQEEN